MYGINFLSFRCTNEGIYDTPGPNDPWPSCTPQQESKYLTENTDFSIQLCIFSVVILAVEQMLGNFDQQISDRYKLIDYKEDDDEKQIIYFSSLYFAEVTLPVVSCTYFIEILSHYKNT